MSTRFGLVTVTLLALTGCQDQMMSNDRMQSSIAGVLGVPSSDVTL